MIPVYRSGLSRIYVERSKLLPVLHLVQVVGHYQHQKTEAFHAIADDFGNLARRSRDELASIVQHFTTQSAG